MFVCRMPSRIIIWYFNISFQKGFWRVRGGKNNGWDNTRKQKDIFESSEVDLELCILSSMVLVKESTLRSHFPVAFLMVSEGLLTLGRA